MKILKYPNPILLEKAKPVEDFGPSLFALVQNLTHAIRNVEWGNPVGMAAPQIGDSRRVFIAEGDVYVNPEIQLSNQQDHAIEGCYSLEENKDYPVWRAQSVWIKYQDIKGEWHEKKLSGFQARVVQQEFDHLEGKSCASESQEVSPQQ